LSKSFFCLLRKQRLVSQVHGFGFLTYPPHESVDQLLVLRFLLGTLLFNDVELHIENCQLILDVGNELGLCAKLKLQVRELAGRGAVFGRQRSDGFAVPRGLGSQSDVFLLCFFEAGLGGVSGAEGFC